MNDILIMFGWLFICLIVLIAIMMIIVGIQEARDKNIRKLAREEAINEILMFKAHVEINDVSYKRYIDYLNLKRKEELEKIHINKEK